MSVALLAGRPLSAAVTVPKLVSPSPGTLVWTVSTSGSARRIVSASIARSRTASELVPAGGATVIWRIFSEPALMNCVGRSGTIAIETTKRAVAPAMMPHFVVRLRRASWIVGV